MISRFVELHWLPNTNDTVILLCFWNLQDEVEEDDTENGKCKNFGGAGTSRRSGKVGDRSHWYVLQASKPNGSIG